MRATDTSPVVAHLAYALEMHGRYCRDQRIAVPSELVALLGVLRSCQEQSSFPARLDPGDDAGVPLAYDYAESGRLLGVSASTVTRLVRDGRLRAIAIGRAKRIPLTELEGYIAGQLTDEGDMTP